MTNATDAHGTPCCPVCDQPLTAFQDLQPCGATVACDDCRARECIVCHRPATLMHPTFPSYVYCDQHAPTHKPMRPISAEVKTCRRCAAFMPWDWIGEVCQTCAPHGAHCYCQTCSVDFGDSNSARAQWWPDEFPAAPLVTLAGIFRNANRTMQLDSLSDTIRGAIADLDNAPAFGTETTIAHEYASGLAHAFRLLGMYDQPDITRWSETPRSRAVREMLVTADKLVCQQI